MKFSPACVSALLAPVLVTARLSGEFDERHLAASNCDCPNGRPDINKSGPAFRNLVSTCVNNVNDENCPGPLNCWNTGSVTDMREAFKNSNLNDPLECWDTSHVTSMASMFERASSFDQSLDEWDTSQVTDMRNMFHRASSFNQCLSTWNTTQVTNMHHMFF